MFYIYCVIFADTVNYPRRYANIRPVFFLGAERPPYCPPPLTACGAPPPSLVSPPSSALTCASSSALTSSFSSLPLLLLLCWEVIVIAVLVISLLGPCRIDGRYLPPMLFQPCLLGLPL